jgi:hypothetical protein
MTSTFAQVREYLEPLYDLVGNNEFTLKEIEDDLPQITKAVLTNLQNRRVILVNRRVGDIKIYEIQEFYRNLLTLVRVREQRQASKVEVSA